MARKIQLADLLRSAPPGCWLVVDTQKMTVVATCKEFTEACAVSRKAGLEDPLVLWSPPKAGQAAG